MKPLVLLLCLALATPALAEGDGPSPAPPPGPPAGPGDMSKGLDLLQQGGRLMLRGMLAQMEPKMREMMATLGALMGDLSAYEAPVVLPNGDILIRRKVPLVPIPPGDPGNETRL